MGEGDGFGADGTDAGAGGAGEGMGGLGGGFGTAGDGTDTGADPGYGGFADAFGAYGGYSMAPDTSNLAAILDGYFGDPDAGPMSMDAGQQSLDLGSLFSESEMSPIESIFAKLGLPKGLQQSLMTLAKFGDKTGLVGKAGLFGNMKGDAKAGQQMAQQGLTTLATMVNPLAGFAMTMANKSGLTDGLTSQFGNTVGLQGGQPANSGVGGMLEGLGGMYSAYKGMSDSGKMLGGLQGLYSQNSPYAQQMRQSLQRRDAAGGRRSQYGPREVELQAKLAQMASSQIPAMNQLQQRQNMNRAIMLQQGLGAFNKMGGLEGLQGLFGLGGAGGMFDQAASGLIGNGSLGNLFNLDPFQNNVDTSWIPDYGDPFGGP